MRRLLPLAVLAAVSILLASCGGHDPDAIQDARSALEYGEFEEAIKAANRALRGQKGDVDALILRGIAQALNRDNGSATKTFEQAWKIAPQHFYAGFFYGWSLARVNRYGDAIQPLEKAVELRPNHEQARRLLARCYLEQELPGGIEHLERLADMPSVASTDALAVIYINIAYLHWRDHNYRAAARALQTGRSYSARDPYILQNLAVLYDQYIGDTANARRYYILAIQAYQAIDEDATHLQKRLRDLARN